MYLLLKVIRDIYPHQTVTPQFIPNTILIYRFLEIYEKYGGPDEGTLKLKKPTQLQEILDVTRTLLEGLDDPVLSPITENHNKLNQMKTVLEM